MASSAQLEQEAEQTRSELARTLDELRERITPGQFVDQAVDYAKASGGGQFVRNLGRQTVSNPFPVALIGAGLAWLMLANGTRSGGRSADNIRDGLNNTAEGVAQGRGALREGMSEASREATAVASGVTGAASDATAAAGRAATAASEGAASLYGSVKSSASDAYGHVADVASDATARTADAATDLGRKSMASTSDFLKFCRNQPLVLAGLGVAFGAIIGMLIPATETENQLMGERSDELKEHASQLADEQFEKSKQAVEDTVQQAREKLQPSGPERAGEQTEASLVPEEARGVAEEFLD